MPLLNVLAEPTSIAVIVITSTLAASALFHRRNKAGISLLPPSPPVDSLIFGHTIPDREYRKFEEWTKQYGPVFSLRQGLTTTIIIGRDQPAVEIMEREGAHLADRPPLVAAGETLSGGMRVITSHAGERINLMRKALRTHLQLKDVQAYAPLLMKHAKRFLFDIFDIPGIHEEHAKRCAAAVGAAISYAKPIGGYDDPDVLTIYRCMTRLGDAFDQDVWRINFYSWLRYVPGYLREIHAGHQEELNLFKQNLQRVRGMIVRGEPTPPSFAKYLLSQQESLGLSDDETAYLAGTIFGATSDAVPDGMIHVFLIAARYPDAQRKVQEELDAVIGHDRAPTFADEDDLPQLQAFLLETYRWAPVATTAFPHRATKDIVWQNYVIPKGATVIANIWSINRDPAHFSNPEDFDPQRWLTAEGRIRNDLKIYPFGFGRRVCPAQHLVEACIYINAALVLWAYNVCADPKHPIGDLAFTRPIYQRSNVVFEPRLRKGNMEAIKEMLKDYGGDA